MSLVSSGMARLFTASKAGRQKRPVRPIGATSQCASWTLMQRRCLESSVTDDAISKQDWSWAVSRWQDCCSHYWGRLSSRCCLSSRSGLTAVPLLQDPEPAPAAQHPRSPCGNSRVRMLALALAPSSPRQQPSRARGKHGRGALKAILEPVSEMDRRLLVPTSHVGEQASVEELHDGEDEQSLLAHC